VETPHSQTSGFGHTLFNAKFPAKIGQKVRKEFMRCQKSCAIFLSQECLIAQFVSMYNVKSSMIDAHS
tara:strand:- start:33349 stop:33552 length:204 start_codon:yes stop_codon:yes gene_type:complete